MSPMLLKSPLILLISVPVESGIDCSIAEPPFPGFTLEAPHESACAKGVPLALSAWAHAKRRLAELGVAHDVAEDIELATVLQPRRPGTAKLKSGLSKGRYTAIVQVGIPAEEPSTVALDGRPHDWDHLARTLVHEYATVRLDRHLRTAKPSGFGLYDTPSWFHQGLPEYIASVGSPRGEVYRKMVIEGSDNVYVVGEVLVAQMLRRYGKEAFGRFLLCERSFDACRSTMGIRQ